MPEPNFIMRLFKIKKNKINAYKNKIIFLTEVFEHGSSCLE